MKHLLHRWPPHPVHGPELARPDQRPHLAGSMCRWCARCWLAGSSIWHRDCAQRLAYAIDLHFERLHEQS